MSAATEAAKNGLHPLVLDENAKPGGQLFKQIHKFLVPKNIRQKYGDLKSARNFWKKQKNMV